MISGKNQYIQALRGIGIVLVCMHHALRNIESSAIANYLLRIAQSDVVFFFVIAGFLYQTKIEKYLSKVSAFLSSKAKQLLIPYLFWSSVLFVGGGIIHRIIGGRASEILEAFGFPPFTLAQTVLGILTMKYVYVEHVWFLYILFVLFVLNATVFKKAISPAFFLIWVGVAGILHSCLEMPYLVWMTIKHVPDFAIGRYVCTWLDKNGEKTGLKENMSITALSLAFYVCSAITSNSANIVGVIVNAYSNSFFRWTFVFLCYLLIKQYVLDSVISRLSSIGDYSFDIYLMHTPYVVPIVTTALIKMMLPWGLVVAIATMLGIIIPMIMSKYILRKIVICDRIMLGHFNS